MSFDINYDIPTIITKRNVDSMENPIGVKLLEKKQVMDNHSCIVLSQIPDENYRITIEGFNEVFNSDELGNNNFYVSYSQGVIYFLPRYNGKTVVVEYYGIGYELISASRVFYKYDKHGGIIETLEEILDNAKEQLELIKTLGDSVKVIEKLEMDLENGKVLHGNLENDIEVGTPLQENLHSDIVEAKKWKDQLHQDVADGKVLQPLLQQTVDDAEDVKIRLDKSIADAQEDIATIEATGNKEVIIQSSQWRLNGDVYEKEITHPCNSENLHVTAKNSDTKEAVTIGYKILDKTRILLKSDESISMSVILSASYYHATQTISDDIAEEVVKARKGEESLDVKITKIDEQLDNKANKNEVVKRGYGTLNDFDENTRALLQGLGEGETNINAVLGIENVKNENISSKTISIEKTSFFEAENPNLVTNIKERGYYVPATGNWEDRDDIFTCDFIKAKTGDVLYTNTYSIYLYDINKNFLHESTYIVNGTYDIKVEGTEYVRPNFKYANTSIAEAYLKLHGDSSNFYSENLKLKNENLPLNIIKNDHLDDGCISAKKLDFTIPEIVGSENILNKYTIKEKGFYNPTSNSTWIDRDDIFTTEQKIERANELDFIYTTNAYSVYFYDKDGNYTREIKNYPTSFTVMENENFIRPNFKYESTSISEAQLCFPRYYYTFDDNIIKTKEQQMLNNNKFMHISCDDVIDIFEDLTNNSYNSIFENSVLKFLKEMNDSYGMVFSGYCFYEKSNGFNLSQVPSTYATEFKENNNWLKFGFHALNTSNYTGATYEKGKQDYELVITELYRICGGLDSIDRVPRTQNYAGSLEACKAWYETDKCSIIGLLSAEDTRTSYYHSDSQRDYLQKHDKYIDYENGLTFYSTDLRLENVNNVTNELNNRLSDISYSSTMNALIIFTHENHLSTSLMRDKIRQCCVFAKNNGYNFDYPMNKLI